MPIARNALAGNALAANALAANGIVEGGSNDAFPTETIKWTYGEEPLSDKLFVFDCSDGYHSVEAISSTGSIHRLESIHSDAEPDSVLDYSDGDTLTHHSHPNDYLAFEDYDASGPGIYPFAPFSDFI
jgi:hypothetical protein